jgi:putative membrane protein
MDASSSVPAEVAAPRPFYGRPFAWLLFALVLLIVPTAGYLRSTGMRWQEIHPAINAMLNGSSAVFLGIGRWAIAGRRIRLHRGAMIAAFTASSLFLGSYLARYALSGSHHYPGTGWDRTAYLVILSSHMLLAIVLLPLAITTLLLGLRRRDARHRRIARWTWPLWIYVSVTGVAVYLMLYQLAPRLHGG